MTKKKNYYFCFIYYVFYWLCLFLLQKLFMPKYVHGIVEGSLIEEYYTEEEKNHDIIFIGDCEVYETFTNYTLGELWDN